MSDETAADAVDERRGGRTDRDPASGGTWAYESIVTAIPGLQLSGRNALVVQFLLFEGAAAVLAAYYGLWNALLPATAAVLVTTAGSGLMLYLADRIRDGSPPEAYRRLLFESSIEVVLGLLAFVGLVTYLFVLDPRQAGTPLLESLLGSRPPAPAVYFTLLLLWDVCYRIGTGWWASVTGLWRSVALVEALPAETRQTFRRADLVTIGFASLQLLLVPFVAADAVLAWLVVGHVAAVYVVSTLSVLVLSRR